MTLGFGVLLFFTNILVILPIFLTLNQLIEKHRSDHAPLMEYYKGGGVKVWGELVWWKGVVISLVPHPPSNSALIHPTVPSSLSSPPRPKVVAKARVAVDRVGGG